MNRSRFVVLSMADDAAQFALFASEFSSVDSAVVALMRDVARNVVMPRYQNLASSEISEKADADDLVAEPREGGLLVRFANGAFALLEIVVASVGDDFARFDFGDF